MGNGLTLAVIAVVVGILLLILDVAQEAGYALVVIGAVAAAILVIVPAVNGRKR